jgi:hypothetical protein
MGNSIKLTPEESFFSHLEVLRIEKIINDRIMDKLDSFIDYSEKVKYCRKLLKTKDLLTKANQSKRKRKNLAYDNFKDCLKNLDILEKDGIFKKEKHKSISNDKEVWKTKNSVRAISTRMYS